jgi:antirestriction protein ArdC
LSHFAGAPHRLNRDLSGRFGSVAYSREELVAEISSVTIGTELNLPTDIFNHASYIQSWIKNLKTDKREIFRAAAAAQKCADYCLGFHPDYAASVTHSADNEPQDDERSLAA